MLYSEDHGGTVDVHRDVRRLSQCGKRDSFLVPYVDGWAPHPSSEQFQLYAGGAAQRERGADEKDHEGKGQQTTAEWLVFVSARKDKPGPLLWETCRLYTSSSPRYRQKPRMPSSA